MKTGKPISLLFASALLAACTTNPKDYWKLEKVEDPSTLTVSFDLDQPAFTRVTASRSQHVDGWVESGTWEAHEEGAGKSEVWIFIATLYKKAFKKDGIRPMKDLVDRVSGDSYLEFSGRGSLKTDSGNIDYIFYRASAQPCLLIRKYWNDAETAADAGRFLAWDWIAGTNMMYAYYCRASGPDLKMDDLDTLFDGVHARHLYWPGNMFEVVGEADDPQ